MLTKELYLLHMYECILYIKELYNLEKNSELESMFFNYNIIIKNIDNYSIDFLDDIGSNIDKYLSYLMSLNKKNYEFKSKYTTIYLKENYLKKQRKFKLNEIVS